MKILIISEYIAPFQSIASIRWTKIAKYIKKFHPKTYISVVTNQKEYVLASESGKPERRDELLEKDLIYFDKYIEVPNSKLIKIYNKVKSRTYKKVRKIFHMQTMRTEYSGVALGKMLLLELVHDFKDWLFFFQEKRIALKEAVNYDVVISTYSPVWTHLIGERVKKAYPQLIWIADFRDPYAQEGETQWSYNRHRRFTMEHLKKADMITCVNNLLLTYTPVNVPIYTIPNGFDLEEKSEKKVPQKFSVVFTGTLCGKYSDIGIICKALLDLCSEGKIIEKDIEVSYAGSYGEIAKALAAEYQAERILCDYGVISRQESLKMQQTAAILLLAAENTKRDRCFWTGKAYEYMMAEKPIIYVVTGNIPHSEPSKYIDRLGGYCYEQCRHEETYQGMKDYILEKYQEWKATGNVTVQQDKDYVEQFAYPHIAEQVWKLIQEGMRKRNESGTVKEN